MKDTQEMDSPSSTFMQHSQVESPDWGTTTAPPHRPWREFVASMIARPVMAGMMLAAQGTTVLAEAPKDTVEIVANAAQPNGQSHVRFERVDPTTMSDVASKPDLRRQFDLRDRSTVLSFLQENSFLYNVLPVARSSISMYFGEDTPLTLEVFSDPDEPGSDQLFLLIHTRLSVDDALTRLDGLDREWGLKVAPRVRNKMTIDIEPV